MTTASAEQAVLDGVKTRLYIGGDWRDAAGGGTLPVEDPATGETLAEVADATRRRTRNAALGAADEAFQDFRNTPPRERGEILRRAYELIIERADDLALLMTLEMGKPVAESQGRDRLRRRLLPLVRRGGGAHQRPLHGQRERRRPRADDAAAGRPVRLHHAVELPAGDGHAQDRPGDRRRLHVRRQAGQADAAVDARAGARSSRRPGLPGGVVNVITATSRRARSWSR